MFVIGGWDRSHEFLDTIEVLDLENIHDLVNPPVWQVLDTRLDIPRMRCVAVVVENEIYILGGLITVGRLETSSVQVLDVNAETLSQGPPLIKARCECATALVGNSILVTGGQHLGVKSTEFLLVDENDPQWQPLEPNIKSLPRCPISVAYGNCFVVLGNDGKVTVWESSSRTWTTLKATLQHGRRDSAAVMLGDDLVVFCE